MARNNLVLVDAEGDWPDWIEIENTSASSVNLAGWNLAIYVQDAGSPGGTPFPDGMLTAWNITKDARPWVLKDDKFYVK